VISRGGVISLFLGDEKEVLALSLQHNLQIFSIALPQPPLLDIKTLPGDDCTSHRYLF
jgi:hypothetical protein